MAALPRALGRYPLGARVEGEALDRWRATDRERGAAVIVSRVPFGPERREERDACVERVRALFTVSAPALIAALDAGAWDDDAFVVEEAVVEPRPCAEAMPDLDTRERALAARSLAEGVACLNAAGWSIDHLDERDVLIDAYRQPRLAVALRARHADASTKAIDLDGLHAIVSRWVDVARASSAAELAASVVVPATDGRPLLPNAQPPTRSIWLWVVIAVLALVVLVVLVTR